MKTKAIGETVMWHVEGSLEEVAEGIVIGRLEWPTIGGVRAYIVSRDHPTIKVSIIPIDRVEDPDA